MSTQNTIDTSSVQSTGTSVTWDDSYKLSIPMIDQQHKRFFDIYDDLLNYSKNQVTNEQINIIIERLDDYMKIHFREEEALMLAAKYEGLEEHIKEHRFFEKKINELKLAETYKNPLLLSQLLLFIRKWFLSHILKMDLKYKESVMKFIKEKKD